MNDLLKSFNNTYEAHVFNFLKDASVVTTIMALMRILDVTKNDRASMPKIIEMLKDNEFKIDFLENNFVFHFEYEKNNIHQVIKEVISGFEGIDKDTKDRLKAHRNHIIAHSLLKENEETSPTYGELLDLRDRLCPIVNKIFFLAEGVWCDPHENTTSEVWHTYSKYFWRRLV